MNIKLRAKQSKEIFWKEQKCSEIEIKYTQNTTKNCATKYHWLISLQTLNARISMRKRFGKCIESERAAKNTLWILKFVFGKFQKRRSTWNTNEKIQYQRVIFQCDTKNEQKKNKWREKKRSGAQVLPSGESKRDSQTRL